MRKINWEEKARRKAGKNVTVYGCINRGSDLWKSPQINSPQKIAMSVSFKRKGYDIRNVLLSSNWESKEVESMC